MKLKQLVLAALLAALGTAEAAKPNIIYILVDDMGPGDVSCYNPEGLIQTPNIDRMAAEGMKFMDAHTSASVCTPTRYGILTGRYSWRTHLKEGVVGLHDPSLISMDRETVASFMKKEGYATACIGKWHLGQGWANNAPEGIKRITPKYVDATKPIKDGPLDLGFDYYFGAFPRDQFYVEGRQMLGDLELVMDKKELTALGYFEPDPGWISKGFKQREKLKTLVHKTGGWIRNHAENPFFIYLALPSPHGPVIPHPDFQGKSGICAYADYCMETDWVVGEVLKTLDELKLAENTMVFFTADNGSSPGGPDVKNLKKAGHDPSWIYRGAKGSIYEGGHRLPFVVRWPRQIKAGSVSEQTICTTDLLATCAELVGKKLPDNVAEDSISFLPALKGDPIPDEENRLIVHHDRHGYFAARKGKWKLVLDSTSGGRYDLKKQRDIQDASEMMLFDMDVDREETRNLASQYPEVTEQLKKELADLISKGRSTPGTPQANDPLRDGQTWHQFNALQDDLK